VDYGGNETQQHNRDENGSDDFESHGHNLSEGRSQSAILHAYRAWKSRYTHHQEQALSDIASRKAPGPLSARIRRGDRHGKTLGDLYTCTSRRSGLLQ
jgi:hypothetical protein